MSSSSSSSSSSPVCADVPQYLDFLSEPLVRSLLARSRPHPRVPQLSVLVDAGANGGAAAADVAASTIESDDALRFLLAVYAECSVHLRTTLQRRADDRAFIDTHTRLATEHNAAARAAYTSPDYRTAIGSRDAESRVVVGPSCADAERYYRDARDDVRSGKLARVAPLPPHLRGPHVTLFGPPDSARMALNAMNCLHRRLPGEPALVAQLVDDAGFVPKWGADDEDSKTPLPRSLLDAAYNLDRCYARTLRVDGVATGIAETGAALPIKRVPGLALPSTSHFVGTQPLPLHLYDLCLHVWAQRRRPEALTFYVPKLEGDNEGAYLRHVLETCERLADIPRGTVRIICVLENPRAVFRINELVSALHPYFAGASLGWHDYLAATARLFMHDPHYRIPIKADPNIVVRHIRESHVVLANTVAARGGLAIGGMYGILPEGRELRSPSFQVTLVGYVRDVVAQLKRGLNGFWVAHPDFVRIGVALVAAYRRQFGGGGGGDDREPIAGDRSLDRLIDELIVDPAHRRELADAVHKPDIAGLDPSDPCYQRALLAADVVPEAVDGAVRACDEEEVRYNVFQALQYIADWLGGTGCVALPARVRGVSVRVMDDLATTERSRWEVWHEVAHGRFARDDVLRVLQEEMLFIRRDARRESDGKAVRVRWDERTARWYPVARNILARLMLDEQPVEFATELLLPFTIPALRAAADPWTAAAAIDAHKFSLPPYVARFLVLHDALGAQRFATTLAARSVAFSWAEARRVVDSLDVREVREAASFHGNIGERKVQALDERARAEQAAVLADESDVRQRLLDAGAAYARRFGFKFLVAARGKAPRELLALLERRLASTDYDGELAAARCALYEIAAQRLRAIASEFAAARGGDARCFALEHGGWQLDDFVGVHDEVRATMDRALREHSLAGMQVSFFSHADPAAIETRCAGLANAASGERVTADTRFQICSISKSFGAVLLLSLLPRFDASSESPVNALLDSLDRGDGASSSSSSSSSSSLGGAGYRLESADGVPSEYADEVRVEHLLSHTSGLSMHYLPGLRADCGASDAAGTRVSAAQLLTGAFADRAPAYTRPRILWRPGSHFQYSGAAFVVVQLLLERIAARVGKSLEQLAAAFCAALGIDDVSFSPDGGGPRARAVGYASVGAPTPHGPPTLRAIDWLWFPPFGAGGVCSAASVCRLYAHLARAYDERAARVSAENGSSVVPHAVAANMMLARRSGTRASVRFIGGRPGLGGFVCETAEGSRFFLHQAANDGFRGMSLVCFAGPGAGQGMVLLANTDGLQAVLGLCEVAQVLLRRMGFDGVDSAVLRRAASSFDRRGIASVELVNRAQRYLLYDAFQAAQPPVPPRGIESAIDDGGAQCELARAEPRVLYVSNERFARATNLFARHRPSFDPQAFNPMGKTMDSWESVRHNPDTHDTLDLDVAHAANGAGLAEPRFVVVSTAWHDGNHSQGVSIDALVAPSRYDDTAHDDTHAWRRVLPRRPLDGHSLHVARVDSTSSSTRLSHVRVNSFPDGGISRVRFFSGELPRALAALFGTATKPLGAGEWRVRRIDQVIPPVRKPVALSRSASGSGGASVDDPVLARARLADGEMVDVASAALGGRVVAASNEHYGPASAVISPFVPQGMFDGFESARSRVRDHVDWVEVALAVAVPIVALHVDFTFFVNNNPRHMLVDARNARTGVWSTIVPRTFTKPLAGNRVRFDVRASNAANAADSGVHYDRVRFVSIPDGGFNRVRVVTRWRKSYDVDKSKL